jgi:phosphonate transport system substrate-binding protein
VPQLAVSDTYLAWTPLLDRIGKNLNICFDLKVLSGIPRFEADLVEGKPDFAYMNPYHLLIARKKQGYLPVVADSQNQLSGIIVVRKDSKISSIKELNGENVAFPAPNAMAASLLVKTHGNVYRSVAIGDFIAGGGVNNTFKRESEALQKELKVIFETPKIMPHPIAAHPRIPKEVRIEVARSFIDLAKDPNMAVQFDAIQMPKPIAVSYERDYQNLEKLSLEKFARKSGE